MDHGVVDLWSGSTKLGREMGTKSQWEERIVRGTVSVAE